MKFILIILLLITSVKLMRVIGRHLLRCGLSNVTPSVAIFLLFIINYLISQLIIKVMYLIINY